MAGVPGLEPGPTVLETDMLTIDTIPLKNFRFAIADLRLHKEFLQIANHKLQIENWTIYFPDAADGSGIGCKTF